MAKYAHENMRLISKRKSDPYLDRRSGEDRRKVYSLDYFMMNNPDRRTDDERRGSKERRRGCIRINDWSSVCPYSNETKEGHEFIVKLH